MIPRFTGESALFICHRAHDRTQESPGNQRRSSRTSSRRRQPAARKRTTALPTTRTYGVSRAMSRPNPTASSRRPALHESGIAEVVRFGLRKQPQLLRCDTPHDGTGEIPLGIAVPARGSPNTHRQLLHPQQPR